jgi:hypothetical protein
MSGRVVKKSAAPFCRLRHFAGTLFCALALESAGAAEALRIEAVAGQPFLAVDYAGGTDFSGLTWAGGEDFFAVSDKARALFSLRLRIDPASGRLLEGAFKEKFPIQSALSDFEGVALQGKTGRLFISAEGGTGFLSIAKDGSDARSIEAPKIFKKARRNLSLESLSFGAGAFWSANEEALEGDGPIADAARGSLVRLQKFDSAMRPIAQFAYRTEPCGRRFNGAGTGVSDLLALPEGELFVLERVFGVFGLSVKIFQVRLAGATDTTRLPALEGGRVVPVEKTLLFEMPTFSGNFEGITLGPTLSDGWRSVLLVADSAGATSHLFMALRLSPAPGK